MTPTFLGGWLLNSLSNIFEIFLLKSNLSHFNLNMHRLMSYTQSRV